MVECDVKLCKLLMFLKDLYVFLSVQVANNDAARVEVQSDLSVCFYAAKQRRNLRNYDPVNPQITPQ